MAKTALATTQPNTPAPVDPNEILKQLSGRISQYQAPSGWAFDPQYEQTVNNINSKIAGLTSANTTAMQRTNEDYDTNVGKAGKANSNNLEYLQNKLAAQGIGYSGINVKEQGKLGEAYQEALTGLNTGKTRSQEDIAFNSANQAADLQNQLGQSQVERAGRQTAREQEAAAIAAQAEAARTTADQQRQWIGDLTSKITALVQPQATPTGQMALPPSNPQAVVQKALAAVPPPAAKTPQQQIADTQTDPKYLQKLLQIRGFDPGPIDGIIGKKSQLALAQWKQSVGLPATADFNADIMQKLLSSGIGNNSTTGRLSAFPQAGPARRSMV